MNRWIILLMILLALGLLAAAFAYGQAAGLAAGAAGAALIAARYAGQIAESNRLETVIENARREAEAMGPAADEAIRGSIDEARALDAAELAEAVDRLTS